MTAAHEAPVLLRLIGALMLALAGAAAAADAACREITFEATPYTVCRADPAQARLFLRDEAGRTIGTFSRLARLVESRGRRLRMAMNGGMYHADRRPVGLYVEEGREIAPLVTGDGPGNFGLTPNGVLCLTGAAARIMTTDAYARDRPACRFAAQSGPMLVIGSDLHPRFLPDSASRTLRNGVGAGPEGDLLMAISDAPVTFHSFARLFRDRLDADNALFLDGAVSRLYAPGLGRADFGLPLGPILAVIGPAGAGE